MTAADRARLHLERLASAPRPAGSPAEEAARRYCAATLAGAGFSWVEERFEYSTIPGKWATVGAGIASMVALAAAGHVGSRGGGREALAILLVVLAVGVPAALGMARSGVLAFRFGRATGVNLRATRGAGAPAVWLVAHLDSKSQPVSIAVRAIGVMGSAVAWIAALVVAASQVGGLAVAGWWIWVTGLGVVAGLPVAASVVGGRSPGAVDNASGVAAVLLAVEGLDRATPVGVLLTSAEELGLVGARAAAATLPAHGPAGPAIALNCDTVDDDANMLCLVPRGRGGRASGALIASAASLGVPIVARRVLPGVLVDSVALADAGWDCATLSAARWRTLGRVHTPRDRADSMRGAGIGTAADILAEAAARLARGRPTSLQ